MKKPQIRRIVPHFVHDEQEISLSDRIADLHTQIIARRLRQLDLTAAQKRALLDQIIANLKASEIQNGNRLHCCGRHTP